MEQVKAVIPKWQKGFMRGTKGAVISTVENFLLILENDEHFSGLQFNLLAYCPEQIRNFVPVRWTDADDAEARRYIEATYGIHSKEKLSDALRIVFRRNEYHPIRDCIETIKWDGQKRISNFLHFATGCENTPYTREVSRLIFAGGINRLYHPGCKFDDMPVLIGTRQGEGKSTLVRWIAMQDEWFGEINEIDGQKGIEALEGIWIAEMAEMLAMVKAKEQESMKAFVTRQRDRYRHPFDVRVTEHPRQCIFIGTTNKRQFLTDKTGNRRFYPVEVQQSGYDLFNRKDEIQEYIRQCWAEARAALDTDFMMPYAARSLLHEIREQQAEATEDDYREGLIRAYLDDNNIDEICVFELWCNALHKDAPYSKPNKKDSDEISLILSSFDDFEKSNGQKRFGEFGKQRYWKRIKPEYVEQDIPF